MFDNRLADREPQASTLCKGIKFDKSSEDAVQLVFRYPTAGIGNIKVQEIGVFEMVSECNAPFLGKLYSVVYKIGYYLSQSVFFYIDQAIRHLSFIRNCYIFILIVNLYRTFEFLEQVIDIRITGFKFQSSGFDFRDVQYIVDKL